MDNAYKSLNGYHVVKIRSRTVRINKLNLGQYIEFVNHYKIITAQKILKSFQSNLLNKSVRLSVRECVRLATGRYSYGHRTDRAIVDRCLALNRPEKQQADGAEKTVDPNYFQSIVHIIARHYHWSKDQILALYPDEVMIYADRIMQDIRQKYKEHALFIADLNFIVSKSVVSKSGFGKLQSAYEAQRKRIMAEGGPEGNVRDLEAFKASQKAWLEKNGISLPDAPKKGAKNGN